MSFGIISKGILAKGCHAGITSYCDCHFQLSILNGDIINVCDIWYYYISWLPYSKSEQGPIIQLMRFFHIFFYIN